MSEAMMSTAGSTAKRSAARAADDRSAGVREEVLNVVAWAAEQPLACNASVDPILTRAIDTPLGVMVAGACRDGLCLLEFADRRALPVESRELSRVLGRAIVAEVTADGERIDSAAARNPHSVEHLDVAQRELEAYFAGVLTDFSVTLFMPGSAFERRVWTALQQIRYGQTTSYGRLAFKLGVPGAARAVGRSNGRNRIAIVVPCHRVIQEDGTLGGYGGGLDRKQKLLALERDGASQGRLF